MCIFTPWQNKCKSCGAANNQNLVLWSANKFSMDSCNEANLIFKKFKSGDGFQNCGSIVGKTEKFHHNKVQETGHQQTPHREIAGGNYSVHSYFALHYNFVEFLWWILILLHQLANKQFELWDHVHADIPNRMPSKYLVHIVLFD